MSSGIDFTDPATGTDMLDDFLADRREANADTTVRSGGQELPLNAVVKGGESFTGVGKELAAREDDRAWAESNDELDAQQDRATIRDWAVQPDGSFQLERTDGRIEHYPAGSDRYPDLAEQAQAMAAEHHEQLIGSANELLSIADQYGGLEPFLDALDTEEREQAEELLFTAHAAATQLQAGAEEQPDEAYLEQLHASVPDAPEGGHPLDAGVEDMSYEMEVNAVAQAHPELRLDEEWAMDTFNELVMGPADGDVDLAAQMWAKALEGAT